jgi:signal recognition particle subunit SRP54
MIGKSAIDMAKQFNEKIGLTGLIFTKTESDTKAGAILSVKHILNLPIHFLCSGEKIDDIDEFHVERITQRILGMGDIVSLVEKASDAIGEKDNDALKAKAAKGELDLFDVLEQFKFLKKMGGLPFVSKFLPAEMLNQANISENKVKHFEAIILSMTKKERISPKIVMQSTPRKSRIAKGSGTSEKLVHELLMMHSQISKIAQQFAQFDKSSLIDKFKLGNSLSGLGNFMSPGDKKK